MFVTSPRYTFRESGVGCEAHSRTDCLCDVVIDTPVEIASGLMFGDAALREVDAWGVDARNLHDFASVLLGLYDTYMDAGADVASSDDDRHAVAPRVAALADDPLFGQLDERTIRALRAHYRAGTPWEFAVRELGAGWSDEQLRTFRAAYMRRMKQARHDKKARLASLVSKNKNAAVVECEVCGTFVADHTGTRSTCSAACKQKAYRLRKKGK